VLPGAGRLPVWLLRLAPRPLRPRPRRPGLLGQITRIYQQSGGAYGAPRVHAELQIACGVKVGRKRVARLLRTAGWWAVIGAGGGGRG
jgi:hypothetical protein